LRALWDNTGIWSKGDMKMHSLRLLRWTLIVLICLGAGRADVTHGQGACPLAPRLTIGQQGQVLGSSPNNLRESPALSGAITGVIPGGGVFDVLAGPECDPASGFNWWQVAYAGQSGWTAEGDANTYFLEPIHPALLYLSTEFDVPVGVSARDDLVLLDLVTGENHNLTADIPFNLTPDATWRLWSFAWTPRGDRIAFTVEIYIPFHETVDESVYLMNSDGSGKCLLAENAALVQTGMFAIEPVALSGEDGPPLDFAACVNPPELPLPGWRIIIERQQAFAVNASTGERVQLTGKELGRAEYGSVISPDGTIAAVLVADDGYETVLHLIPLANPAAQPVALSGEPTGGPSWSPDGDFLLIAGEDSRGAATTLVRLNVKSGAQDLLYTGAFPYRPLASPAWSPDGEQIAFAAEAEVDVEAHLMEPRLFLMNADSSGLQQLDTLSSLGPILWRPE
jgi:Tol biopolymer transport system component